MAYGPIRISNFVGTTGHHYAQRQHNQGIADILDDKTERFSEPVKINYIEAASGKGQLAISTPSDLAETSERKPVLFFHGATVPTQFTAEYKMNGSSWMGELAQHGWPAFGLDLPGYGRSSGYPNPGKAEPNPRDFGSAASVQNDIDLAVDWILRECCSDKLHVIAISRGAIPAGFFAAANPNKVQSLTLHAPITKKAGIEPEVIEELLGAREIPRTDRFSLSANDRFKLLSEDRPEGTVSSLEPTFVDNWVHHYGETLGSAEQSPVLPAAATGNVAKIPLLQLWHDRSMPLPHLPPMCYPPAHPRLYFIFPLCFAFNVTTCVDKTEDLNFVISRYFFFPLDCS